VSFLDCSKIFFETLNIVPQVLHCLFYFIFSLFFKLYNFIVICYWTQWSFICCQSIIKANKWVFQIYNFHLPHICNSVSILRFLICFLLCSYFPLKHFKMLP
jgi:hypothetical protein